MGRKRVLTALSGGVDSSVSAALLKDQGYEVIGATLQVWDYSKNPSREGFGTCCSNVDVEDARAVCRILKIPFYVINCENYFEEKVIRPFVRDYLSGKTPVPCTNCNTFLKFDYLIDKMKELDCDYLATGHYAEIRPLESGQHGLFAGEDSLKDQTYFLFTLDPKILPKLLFPVGKLQKKTVREVARKKSLPVSEKKDSTGICFAGSKGNYKDFISRYMPRSSKKGELKLYPSGEILGNHEGVHCFTIGQRRGLGVSSNKPLYVVKIDAGRGEVWLGEECQLYSQGAVIEGLNFLDGVEKGETLNVKIRFRHEAVSARIYPSPPEIPSVPRQQKSSQFTDSLQKGTRSFYRLEFLQPQKAVTPGQSAVFYRGRRLVGGGVIAKSLPSAETQMTDSADR